MTSDAWKDFGYAVRTKRLDLGWSLEQLAQDALGNGARKGYVSQIEKGTRNLSPETIDKFDQALSLPKNIVKAVHLAPPPNKTAQADEKRDNTAERLLQQVAKDDTAPPVAEALLTTLAYEFAGEQFRDIHTAYTSLRRALEAAEAIRKRGEMPEGNTGGQLNAVMAEVAKLNDLGALDEADDLLDAEERRMREAHRAEKDRLDQQTANLLAQRLDQDRLRNRSDLAAERLIRGLRQTPQVGGLFVAINDKANEWQEKGDKAGDIFALTTALELAKANYDRAKAKSGLANVALYTLGWCHFRLAERSSNDRHLTVAHNASEAAVKKDLKDKRPVELVRLPRWVGPRAN